MKRFNRQSLNERFTDFADVVSEGMGKWWVTALSILAVLAWLALGPIFHYSDTWQLIINTPTTILEMWIGFLIAAAANRVERRNRFILEQQTDMLAHNQGMHERQLQLLEMVERLVEQEKADLEQIEQTTNTLRSAPQGQPALRRVASRLKEQQANAHLE